MVFRTTTKALKQGTAANKLFATGYCTIHSLLSCTAPVAYNAGVYGWNYDVYVIGDVTICTGYRGMPGEPLKNTAAYEEKAREICSRTQLSFVERRDALNKLITAFISEQEA